MILVPVRSDLDYYGFVITLEGKDYQFTFTWNTRIERWHFDILDANGVSLVEGADVIFGWLVLGRFRNPALPPGDFFFRNVDGTETDAGRDDLGNNTLMYYVESTE